MARQLAIILTLLAAAVASAQPHLVFDRKIGTDWPQDSSPWMSFVGVSSDGRTVVGDAVVSFGEGHLGFWTFPEGKFLRRIEGVPQAISPDFRYLVLQRQIMDLGSSKAIRTVAHKQDTLDAAAFSANGELMAVKGRPPVVKGRQLGARRRSWSYAARRASQ
jgi:hypothetical protein